jgi:hypothetical protein
MANTQFIKAKVEPWVRKQLERRYGQSFAGEVLRLSTGGHHQFNAVSGDHKIIYSIKAASGMTAGGKLPQGKFYTAIAEVYFLSLVSANKRVLLVTNPEFHELLKKRLDGLMAAGTELECMPLPSGLQKDLDAVIAVASKEVTPSVSSAAAENEIA